MPDLVVIHYTAMQSAAAACDTLCNPETEVSAHYLIAQDGTVMSLVAEDMRAWHAGAGSWGAVTDINSRSIGIELDNDGQSPFPDAQMTALITLLHNIKRRWSIRPERVIAHSDMAPARKIDPGEHFEWEWLAREGLAVFWDDIPATDTRHFPRLMKTFGYTATDDVSLLLNAFRLRFRRHYWGDLDETDTGMIANLARRFPVDAPPTNT